MRLDEIEMDGDGPITEVWRRYAAAVERTQAAERMARLYQRREAMALDELCTVLAEEEVGDDDPGAA